jgi:hypothetical protein
MNQPAITSGSLRTTLLVTDTGAARAVNSNAELFAFLLAMLNATISMSSGKGADVAVHFTEKALTTSHFTGKAARSKTAATLSAGASAVVANASLLGLATKLNPAAAIPVVGATVAKKVTLTMGLAGDNDKQAKCIAAAADIAANALTTWGAAATMRAALLAATGVGAGFSGAIVVLSAAQLFVAGYQAHQSCMAK